MKKLRIAICDDEEPVRTLLHGYIKESGYTVKISEYSAGDELIKALDSGEIPDIIFLDIAMGKSDGIDTAKELGLRIERTGRSMRASRPLIIFVTGIPDRMGEAFGVKAFGYLLKPISAEMLQNELRRAAKELECLDGQPGDYIILHVGGNTINARLDDILYVESSGRKSTVHLKNETYEVYRKMEEFERELGKAFFRIHRGYLVNMQHIRSYSKSEVKLLSGEALLISKYKYADFTKAYMDFISQTN